MSLVQTPFIQDNYTYHRKRTASFSVARPSKSPRTSTAMPLRRTESYLSLPTVASASVTVSVISTQGSCRPSGYTVPYQQSLLYYKEQRQRQKAVSRASLNLEPITIRTRLERTYSQPASTPSKQSLPRSSSSPMLSPSRSRPLTRTATLLDVTGFANNAEPTSSCSINSAPFRVPATCRASSPLSPKRHLLPGRPAFPRSKPEPDLYRLAIKTCMRYSPEGQKILQMGPRLALSILTATQDLERMVAEQESRDALMSEGHAMDYEDDSSSLSKSWVDLQDEDWEMDDDDDDDDDDED